MTLLRWFGLVLRHVFRLPIQEAVTPQSPPVPIIIPAPRFPIFSSSPFARLYKGRSHNVTRSSHWRSKRTQHLRYEPTCRACGGKEKLNVHHIIPFHIDPNRELDDTNLITLCENGANCHLMFGHLKDWKAYNPHVRVMAESMLQLIKNRPYA